MTKEPELPDFVKNLEILESLGRLEHPLGEYTVGASNHEDLESVEGDMDGYTS